MKRDYPVEFCDALVAETRRRLFEESIPRIEKCMDLLTEDEIWYKPNANSNSVGNIVLHLCGNVRQWIGTGLGKLPTVRQRDEEFSTKGGLTKKEILEKLKQLQKMSEDVLSKVTPKDLLAVHNVQVYQETGLSILVHVTEHFSYHVGQITFFVKAKKDLDTGYYAENLG
ncbi:MAG: putative damage-inducible protein DinB [Saprospiraceae bacterium]|jgi:uncharacterized damage-inducible protein DinB